MRNCYVILQVPRDASLKEIRKAYRKLALRHHPDRRETADAERFREVQEAYEILSDTDKRKAHNHELEAHEQRLRSGRRRRSPQPVWSDFQHVAPTGGEILDRLRTNLFSFPGRRAPVRELRVEFVLSPEEAASGGTLPLEIPVQEHCAWCGGQGSEFPFTCFSCDGEGWKWGSRTLTIQIPPGVRDGELHTVRLAHPDLRSDCLSILVTVEPE